MHLGKNNKNILNLHKKLFIYEYLQDIIFVVRAVGFNNDAGSGSAVLAGRFEDQDRHVGQRYRILSRNQQHREGQGRHRPRPEGRL